MTDLDVVRELVAKCTGHPFEKIHAETRLREDLGIEGDDASELLTAFAKRFGLSMEGFIFLDHFDWEGEDYQTWLVILFLRLVSPSFRKNLRASKAREREITVGHLAYCASLGRWVPSTVVPSTSKTRWLSIVFFGWLVVVYRLANLALLLGLSAAAILGSYLAITSQSFVRQLEWGGLALGAGLFLGLMARTTGVYLREKRLLPL